MLNTMRPYGRIALLLVCCAWSLVGRADDWPTYMRDYTRSGATTNALLWPLTPQWVYRAPAAPQPVWPDPHPDYVELPKVKFDDAFYTVAVGDTVYFGSSVDHQLHALDAADGRARWTFFTGGPIRLAPTFAPSSTIGASDFAQKATLDKTESKPTVAPARSATSVAGGAGRVYVGSDDGWVYCLETADGKPVWSFQAAPEPRRVLGNGHIISLWPVRTSLVVENGRVYFGAGVFPSYGYGMGFSGVALYALDATNGQLVWKVDRFDTRTNNFRGSFSPQGYLLTAGRSLFVPSGRSAPACVDIETGLFRYPLPPIACNKGELSGVYGTIAHGIWYFGTQNTLFGLDTETGKLQSKRSGACRLIATDNTFYILKGSPPPYYGSPTVGDAQNDITAMDRPSPAATGTPDANAVKAGPRWRYAHPALKTMILAGEALVAGGSNEVVALNTADGKLLWSAPVEGNAVGLTAAGGRLWVSTDKGTIHCFARGAGTAMRAAPFPPPQSMKAAASDWPAEPSAAVAASLAAAVLEAAHITNGYALVTGPGAARLAYELAKRSDLKIVCLEAASNAVESSRRRLDARGVYGTRVTVDLGAPELPYPTYMANLVVALAGPDAPPPAASELLRVLKPCGGVLLTGAWPGGAAPPWPKDALALWKAAGTLTDNTALLRDGPRWTKLVRGAPEGAGWWTHQHADAGNTGCSGDRRVKGWLDIIRFGAPGANEAPDRHANSVAPLVIAGRVFHQGGRVFHPNAKFKENRGVLSCFDLYNGVRYWQRELSGAYRIGVPAVAGNLACTTDSLFVAAGSVCHRLDARTGKTIADYPLPSPKAGAKTQTQTWNYVAVVDGRLFGSAGIASTNRFGNQYSDAVFAYQLASGRQEWTYRAREIRDATLAYGDGRLFLVENTDADDTPVKGTKKTSQETERRGDATNAPAVKPYVRTVTALDAATGKPVWQKQVDLTDCGEWWGYLQALYRDGVLLLGGAYSPYGRRSEAEAKRKIMALSARDGELLWLKPVGNLSRPIALSNGVVIAEPGVFDLRTGEPAKRTNAETGLMSAWPSVGYGRGGCGPISASAGMAFFRFGQSAWEDLATGATWHLLGVRPGCAINMIPAGGVAALVESSSGCACEFAIQATVVLAPN